MARTEYAFPIAPVLRDLTGVDDIPDVDTWTKLSCPFHDDRNPSARISRFAFRCFSCDRSGDAIKLIRLEEHCAFKAAVARAQEITGGTNRPVRRAGWGSSGVPKSSWH